MSGRKRERAQEQTQAGATPAPPDSNSKSWWIGHPRAGFCATAREREPRLKAIKPDHRGEHAR